MRKEKDPFNRVSKSSVRDRPVRPGTPMYELLCHLAERVAHQLRAQTVTAEDAGDRPRDPKRLLREPGAEQKPVASELLASTVEDRQALEEEASKGETLPPIKVLSPDAAKPRPRRRRP